MFKKLGQKYRKRMLTAPTHEPVDIIQGIFDFAKDIKEESPQLYGILRRYDNEDPIDWTNVDEKELTEHMNYFLKAIDAVAPEGTDFKQDLEGALGFIPNDNVMDPDAVPDGEEVTNPELHTYIPHAAPVLAEKQIQEVMAKVIERTLPLINKK